MYYGRIAIYGGYSSFCSFIPYSVLYCVLCDMFVLLAVRIEKGRGVSRASGWMEDIHGMHVLCEAWYGFVLVWHGRILYMFTIKVREERLMRMPAHTVVLVQSRTLSRTTTTERTANEWIVSRSVGRSVVSFVRLFIRYSGILCSIPWMAIYTTDKAKGWLGLMWLLWCGEWMDDGMEKL